MAASGIALARDQDDEVLRAELVNRPQTWGPTTSLLSWIPPAGTGSPAMAAKGGRPGAAALGRRPFHGPPTWGPPRSLPSPIFENSTPICYG